MNPVIDQLYKIEQRAQMRENNVDDKKENLRQSYKQKQVDFDRNHDLETKEALTKIRVESKQQQNEANQRTVAEYNAEVEKLETIYRQKQEQVVDSIYKRIIKG